MNKTAITRDHKTVSPHYSFWRYSLGPNSGPCRYGTWIEQYFRLRQRVGIKRGSQQWQPSRSVWRCCVFGKEMEVTHESISRRIRQVTSNTFVSMHVMFPFPTGSLFWSLWLNWIICQWSLRLRRQEKYIFAVDIWIILSDLFRLFSYMVPSLYMQFTK